MDKYVNATIRAENSIPQKNEKRIAVSQQSVIEFEPSHTGHFRKRTGESLTIIASNNH